MGLLDGTDIIKKGHDGGFVKAKEGIFVSSPATGLTGPVGHVGQPGVQAALEYVMLRRVANGGWIIAGGEGQPYIGAFSSFDEAINWLKGRVRK